MISEYWVDDVVFPTLLVGAMITSLWGAIRGRPALLGFASVLCLPFTAYLMGSPNPMTVLEGLGMFILPLAGVVAMRLRAIWALWLFTVPFLLICGWLLMFSFGMGIS